VAARRIVQVDELDAQGVWVHGTTGVLAGAWVVVHNDPAAIVAACAIARVMVMAVAATVGRGAVVATAADNGADSGGAGPRGDASAAAAAAAAVAAGKGIGIVVPAAEWCVAARGNRAAEEERCDDRRACGRGAVDQEHENENVHLEIELFVFSGERR
jgi:hypothetical protein